MNLYTFHREEGFYPLELRNDLEAVQNAFCNPGTLKVVNEITGKTVWELTLPAPQPAGEASTTEGGR